MKSLLIFVLFCLSVTAQAQIESVTVQASGLTCSMCSRAIFKALQKVSNVSDVREDIEHSSYRVQFADPANVSPSDLKKAVTDAGFSVARMEITANLTSPGPSADPVIRLSNLDVEFYPETFSPLTGTQKLLILNKGYLPEKERRKYEKPGRKDPGGRDETHFLVTIVNS